MTLFVVIASEEKQSSFSLFWIASSLTLLAMTERGDKNAMA
jgi:hypothetical protein